MKKVVLRSFAILSVVGLYGCGSATQNVRVADVSAQIPQDKAIVVLHRTPTYYGAARGVDIYDNGKLIGDIRRDTKLIWERDPSTTMCLNIDHPLEKYLVNPLIAMVLDHDKPNCFKVQPGKVNKYEFDYTKGLIFTEEEWINLQEQE